MSLKKQIDSLIDSCSGYWPLRLYAQLDYLYELLQAQPALCGKALENVAEDLLVRKQANGCISKADVLQAEERLSCYQAAAKAYTLHMVSYAHIDMDWRWGWDETVRVVIDTVKTMLRLLEEYPAFIYSQSQAAVYEILERYAPELLPKIRQYIRQGRWEVLAATWVEGDKNLADEASLLRQVRYAKQYLTSLLNIEQDTLCVDFEPDTFGHSRFLPRILRQEGVKYYYHCRGNDQEELYRWRAPTGEEVLTFRDPQWYYLPRLDHHICSHVPGFCQRNRVRDAFRIYGVGDHGGGPSRRDIAQILDMQTWPLLPAIRFGTMQGFFRAVENGKENFPVVRRELNYVFTGCYTSQSRLKQANRLGEARLYEAETLCAMAQAAGCDLNGIPSLEEGWKNILFNQFHDILPGSCTQEAKERALGRFQDTCALTGAVSKRAMEAMAGRIATDIFPAQDDPESLSLTGGHGFGNWNGTEVTAVGIHGGSGSDGRVRPYIVFNPTPYDRSQVLDLTLWDWPEPMEATDIRNADGKTLSFDILETNIPYWHHTYTRLAFHADVPAFGYATYYVMPADRPKAPFSYFQGPRVHRTGDYPLILENAYLKAVFCRQSMELISLTHKATGQERLSSPAAYFEYAREQSSPTHSAWVAGTAGGRENLNQSRFVQLIKEEYGQLQQSVCYRVDFGGSYLQVTVSLPEDSEILHFHVEANWAELGSADTFVPQLRFCVPCGYTSQILRCDVPGGHVDRPALGHDVPAIRYAAALPRDEGCALYLTSDCKYGYRLQENILSVSLLRSSFYPDPIPEYGKHTMHLGVGVTETEDAAALFRAGELFIHPLYVHSDCVHTGTLPPVKGLQVPE